MSARDICKDSRSSVVFAPVCFLRPNENIDRYGIDNNTTSQVHELGEYSLGSIFMVGIVVWC